MGRPCPTDPGLLASSQAPPPPLPAALSSQGAKARLKQLDCGPSESGFFSSFASLLAHCVRLIVSVPPPPPFNCDPCEGAKHVGRPGREFRPAASTAAATRDGVPPAPHSLPAGRSRPGRAVVRSNGVGLRRLGGKRKRRGGAVVAAQAWAPACSARFCREAAPAALLGPRRAAQVGAAAAAGLPGSQAAGRAGELRAFPRNGRRRRRCSAEPQVKAPGRPRRARRSWSRTLRSRLDPAG